MEATQTIPNKSLVVFNIRGYQHDFEYEGKTPKFWEELDGKHVIILQLETFTKLGDKDFEYYNIRLENGGILYGISGYHLEPINKH